MSESSLESAAFADSLPASIVYHGLLSGFWTMGIGILALVWRKIRSPKPFANNMGRQYRDPRGGKQPIRKQEMGRLLLQ